MDGSSKILNLQVFKMTMAKNYVKIQEVVDFEFNIRKISTK